MNSFTRGIKQTGVSDSYIVEQWFSRGLLQISKGPQNDLKWLNVKEKKHKHFENKIK